MCLEVTIFRQYTGTHQLLLQDRNEIQKILWVTITYIIYLVWRDRQTILTILFLRSMLHHSYDTLYNIIYISEITLAITIIKNLDGFAFYQFICKTKVCHVRTTCRTIYCKET